MPSFRNELSINDQEIAAALVGKSAVNRTASN